MSPMAAAAPDGSSVRLDAGGVTDTGRRRPINEDELLLRPELGLFAICDGVGGRNSGDLASKLATVSLANFFEASREGDWPEKYGSLMDLTLPPAAQRLCAAVRKANLDVYDIASTREKHDKMSTTVVAAHHEPGAEVLHIVNVGDSRCYGIRKGKMVQLTKDHTLRNEARRQYPDITDERLAKVPKNVLTRALGRKDDVEIDTRTVSVRPDDIFLLCSDGVTREISDRRILEAVLVAETAQEATELLIDLANERGGRDNITALALRFTAG